MSYLLSEAAKACGINKSTVLRAIKSGKISAARNEDGEWQLDPAEVNRVYPAVTRTDAEQEAKQHHAAPFAAQISAMRDVPELLRTQLDDVRQDRDRWRSQVEAITRQIAHDLTAPREPSRPTWVLWTIGILVGAVALSGAKAISAGWVL